jgi:hypothetical protein
MFNNKLLALKMMAQKPQPAEVHHINNNTNKLEDEKKALKEAAEKASAIDVINKMKAEKEAQAKELAKKIAEEEAKSSLQNTDWNILRLDITKLPNVEKMVNIDETIYPHLDNCSNLKSITFADNFNSSINLSKLLKLEHVKTGSQFNQTLSKDTMPSNLKSLDLGINFIKKLENLPDNLEHLSVSHRFNTQINLPNNLKSLSFGDAFNQKLELPNKLESLSFGFHFNKPLVLPKSLKKLNLSTKFNQNITLNDGLEELFLGLHFNQALKLPNSLKILKVQNKDILNKITLNKNVTVLF